MWDKQRVALSFIRKRGTAGAGVFMDPGTGKTRVLVRYLEGIFASTDERLACVVAPLTVLHVWINNWDQWAKTPVLFIDLHETGPAGLRLACEMADAGCRVICLINYEAVWQMGTKMIERMAKREGKEVKIKERKKVDVRIRDINWGVMILDESTEMKNASSTVAKYLLKHVRQNVIYRIVMTGSAWKKRPMDVYSQLKFATGDEVMPETFTKFKLLYTVPHPYIRGAIQGYQNLDQLVKRMTKVAILLTAEECQDLPPVTHTTREVILNAKARKIYKDLTDEAAAEIELGIAEREKADKKIEKIRRRIREDISLSAFEKDALEGECQELRENSRFATSTHVFALMQKQAQIASGFITPDAISPDDAREVIYVGDEKLMELKRILKEREGQPTLIVVQWNAEAVAVVDMVTKEFKFKPKLLDGSVKGAQKRLQLIADASKDICLVVKESVACKGVDILYANMTVFYSHRYDTIDYDQMLKRNHRGEQTMHINYTHLIAKQTVDPKILAGLNRDLDLAAQIEKDWRALIDA
jgi:SNF2 family DNA or RNA helicase